MPTDGRAHVTPFDSKRAWTAELCCAAPVVVALALAAIVAAWPPGAEAATADTRPPTAAQTRAALRSAPQTMSRAVTMILGQLKYAEPVVSTLITTCQGLKSAGGTSPQLEQAWTATISEADMTAAVITGGAKAVKAFSDKATALRPYLRALPSRSRNTLGKAIALMLGAAGFWRDNIEANVRAAQAVAKKDCALALEQRGKAGQYRSQAGDAWVEALDLLQALARTA